MNDCRRPRSALAVAAVANVASAMTRRWRRLLARSAAALAFVALRGFFVSAKLFFDRRLFDRGQLRTLSFDSARASALEVASESISRIIVLQRARARAHGNDYNRRCRRPLIHTYGGRSSRGARCASADAAAGRATIGLCGTQSRSSGCLFAVCTRARARNETTSVR